MANKITYTIIKKRSLIEIKKIIQIKRFHLAKILKNNF